MKALTLGVHEQSSHPHGKQLYNWNRLVRLAGVGSGGDIDSLVVSAICVEVALGVIDIATGVEVAAPATRAGAAHVWQYDSALFVANDTPVEPFMHEAVAIASEV